MAHFQADCALPGGVALYRPVPLQEELQTSLGHAYTLEKQLGGGGMSRGFGTVGLAER